MPPPLRLQPALEAQVAAGAPGALARIEAPRAGNASHVDRWPLVAALCQALRDLSPT